MDAENVEALDEYMQGRFPGGRWCPLTGKYIIFLSPHLLRQIQRPPPLAALPINLPVAWAWL